MTTNVLPSRISMVSGVCTLSSVLIGAEENSCSERSSRGRFDGIDHARALSAMVNSVSSSIISNSPSASWAGNSYRNATPSSWARNTTSSLPPAVLVKVIVRSRATT